MQARKKEKKRDLFAFREFLKAQVKYFGYIEQQLAVF